jgi:hypothetical protein
VASLVILTLTNGQVYTGISYPGNAANPGPPPPQGSASSLPTVTFQTTSGWKTFQWSQIQSLQILPGAPT